MELAITGGINVVRNGVGNDKPRPGHPVMLESRKADHWPKVDNMAI
jgi:hypothetical protein